MSRILGGQKRDQIKGEDPAVTYIPSEGSLAEAKAVRHLSFRAYMPRPAAGAEGDLRIAEVIAKGIGFGGVQSIEYLVLLRHRDSGA